MIAAMPQHSPDSDVEQHGVPPHVDAGQPGRLRVAADGERAPAEGGAVEHHPADRDHRGEDVDQQRDAEQARVGDAAMIGSVTIWLRLPEICSASPWAETSMASVAMNGTIRP